MKSVIRTLCLFATLLVSSQGFATDRVIDHCREARTHVNMAVSEGQSGNPAGLVQHAQEGLEHAKQAQGTKFDTGVERAIDSLQDAIRVANDGDAEKATAHAKESLNYLDSAIAALGG